MKIDKLLLMSAFAGLIACKPKEAAESVPAMAYTLTPFAPSVEFPDAALDTLTYADSLITATISGTSYKLGEQTGDADAKMCANSKEGQHLHIIVDDQPYAAKYEPSFAFDIPDGEHYLLGFLSRSYHESIKTPAAYQAAKVTVAGNAITASMPIEGPMLFYSRPKGLYSGADAEKVMLDFYLVNTDLQGYVVEADINGEKHRIDTWQPYYIEGLPEGDNTIKLSLLDTAGNLVNAPLNPVTRTFQIEKTPKAN